MDPQIGKAAFKIAVFIVVSALFVLPFVEPGTSEFGVTILTLVVGALFIGVIAVAVHRFSR
ncbi:MAG TPA: hypothetical protein EYP04_03425 [Anaerolineae bacterium]|nr:hypothetical protein [Anaerolineae bacterium]